MRAKEEATGGEGHAEWEGREEATPTDTLTPCETGQDTFPGKTSPYRGGVPENLRQL